MNSEIGRRDPPKMAIGSGCHVDLIFHTSQKIPKLGVEVIADDVRKVKRRMRRLPTSFMATAEVVYGKVHKVSPDNGFIHQGTFSQD